MHPFPPHLRHPREAAALAAGAATLASVAVWAVLRRRPTPEQREAQRRERLAQTGRIVDGSLLDALPTPAEPHMLLYRYRIAGVTYECSQDITALSSHVPTVIPFNVDLPIQVRYNRANPGDSIVLAEHWNGLWSAAGYTGRR